LTTEYKQLVKFKWTLIKEILTLNYNVVQMDIDIVVLRNPFYFFAEIPTCSLSATADSIDHELLYSSKGNRYNLFVPRFYQKMMNNSIDINTGFMFWRTSPRAIALIGDFLQPHWRDTSLGDQGEFHNFMHEKSFSRQATSLYTLIRAQILARECLQYGPLDIHVLSATLFPNYPQFLHETSPVVNMTQILPYLIHFNWLSNYTQKEDAMRKCGLWKGS